MQPFHLAIPVDDLDAARGFYGEVLGCAEGRASKAWVDFDFFGHQLTVHRAGELNEAERSNVDGNSVPVRHFGVVLEVAAWEDLAGRLKGSGVPFLIEPRVRFEGKPGEQHTFFVVDPAGNALEFKAFGDASALFRRG